MRPLRLLLCLLLSVAFLPGAALAQSDSGEIHILVTDAATKQPLEVARVLLDGPVMASELTPKNGEVRFTDVPDGIYHARVVKRGYAPITSAAFEILGGRLVTVSVALVEQTNGLKVIGSVSVKASATISSTSLTDNSPQRRLSSDLTGALNKLSGVSVSNSSDDSDAAQTISLEGHDPSQTQLTLDGIPLNAPGSAGNLGNFATDLFGGATVRQGQTLGSAAGSVNFSTLQPTLSWLSSASLSAGSFGRYNYSVAETGSVDKLGIAAQTVYRQIPSLVDGQPPYLDASGLFYDHNGDSAVSGNLLKLRYQFADTESLAGTFLNSTRDSNLVCLREYAPPALPCGYGPNNSSDSSVQLYSLGDNALIGATQFSAALFSTTSNALLDELDRYVDGAASPIGYSTLNRTQGFTLNATLPAKERHTIAINAYGTWSTIATTPLTASSAPFYNGSEQTSYTAVQATDTIHSNQHLTLGISGGVSTATGSSAPTGIGSVTATWHPNALDTYAASYSLGGVSPTAGRAQIFTDPASLRFDCNGNVAYGNAPGQQPGPSSSNSVRATYTHALHGGNVSLTLYQQVQNGVLLPVYVNGSVPVLGLPPTYLRQAEQIYASPAGCNVPKGTPFTAAQLYFSTPVTGVQRTYEGGALTGYVTFGNLVVQPYYDVNVAKANSSSPYFQNPYAITIANEQLPNVPLQKAGVVFDYKAPRSILEWLADAQYTSRNNPNNLPAYATFDAGVTGQLASGALTFAVTNITNTYAGIFAGPANAVPYVTLGGKVIATTARPLTPRAVQVTYAVKFGAGARELASSGSPGAMALGRGGAAPGGGRGFLQPLPSSPPADPFAISGDPQTCSAAGAAAATKLAAELRAYVAQIEAAKTAGWYSATMPAPAIPDAVVTYHGLGDRYALTIVPRLSGGFRQLAGCVALHRARPEDVTARKLYAPTSTVFFVPQVNFMPAVGLYVVFRQQQAGQEQFRVYRLPASAPADPFAVRTSPGCTPDLQNLATQSLAELRAYFATGTAAPNWTIASHAGKSGAWYELVPGDPTVVGAIVSCGRVAAATADELAQRGYDGKSLPALNFAKALGLYLVRPVPPPGRAP